MTKYLLIDGNSIGHAANNGTVLTVGATPVQAIFGFMRTLRRLVALHVNYKVIVLWDGASWRKMTYPDYKANRDKNDTIHEKKMQAAKSSFKRQSAAIEQACTMLGIDQVRATNMEADDLAGIMTDLYVSRGDSVVLVTGDKDWVQLVGPKVVWLDPINDRKITQRTFKEMTGVDTVEQFVEMKALMGDMGDNIPGVGGIGDKGAIEFLNTYQSFTNFSNLCLDGSLPFKGLPKKYRALVEDEEKRMIFRLNIDLMDLRTKVRPAPINLRVTPGAPDKDRFSAFCTTLAFKSILSGLDGWLEVFPGFLPVEEIAA